MTRYLARLIAILLIPCLVTDPMTAATLTSPLSPTRERAWLVKPRGDWGLFIIEALAPGEVGAQFGSGTPDVPSEITVIEELSHPEQSAAHDATSLRQRGLLFGTAEPRKALTDLLLQIEARIATASTRFDELPTPEKEVAHYVAQSFQDKRIARFLQTRNDAVHKRMANIRKALGIDIRNQRVFLARIVWMAEEFSQQGQESLALYEDKERLQKMLVSLGARQKEIAELVALGLTNQEIADALFLSEQTVRTHLIGVYKLGSTRIVARRLPGSEFA